MKGLHFVEDLEDLCEGESGDLGGKYALIHLDGNHFGKIQQDCGEPKDLEAWDRFIQDKRRAALTAMLTRIKARPEWLNGTNVRLETLLWGGDETIWVVPARCGWAFLETWFSLCRDWEFPRGNRLTHAAGMVFCHEKAPIHRVRALAIDLTDASKKISREQNLVSYLVLESFDQVGRDVEKYRDSIAKNFGGAKTLKVNANEMARIRQLFDALRKRQFPRSKIADIARAIADQDASEETRLREGLEPLPSEFTQLESLLGGSKAVWLHLAELWDYVTRSQEIEA